MYPKNSRTVKSKTMGWSSGLLEDSCKILMNHKSLLYFYTNTMNIILTMNHLARLLRSPQNWKYEQTMNWSFCGVIQYFYYSFIFIRLYVSINSASLDEVLEAGSVKSINFSIDLDHGPGSCILFSNSAIVSAPAPAPNTLNEEINHALPLWPNQQSINPGPKSYSVDVSLVSKKNWWLLVVEQNDFSRFRWNKKYSSQIFVRRGRHCGFYLNFLKFLISSTSSDCFQKGVFYTNNETLRSQTMVIVFFMAKLIVNRMSSIEVDIFFQQG